jgi:hypothetical protein
VAFHLAHHVTAKFRAGIKHGQEEAIHLQGGVEALAHEANGGHELREPLEGVVLALHGNKHGISDREGAYGDQAERRGSVNEDYLGVPSLPQARGKLALTTLVPRGELNVDPSEVGRARNERKVRNRGRLGELRGWSTPYEEVIGGRCPLRKGESEAAGEVSLRVKVDHKHATPCMGEFSGEVKYGGGLTNPTLLVRTHDDRRVGSGRVLGGGIHAPIVAAGGYGGVSAAMFHVEQQRSDGVVR